MKAHAFNSKPDTPLLKFRGPVARSDCAEIREERASRRQAPKNIPHLFPKPHKRELARFLSGVADDLVLRVDVVGLQKGDV